MFAQLLSAFFAFTVKAISKVLYKTTARWVTPKDKIHWDELRLAVVLNHTSLYEPLFISAIPNFRIWRAARRLVIPIADSTLARPLVGLFFRILVPNAVGITRKRDDTWTQFLKRSEGNNSLVLIFPEGRMKRKDGLDKHGKPMSVKGGVADLIEAIAKGKMLIAYSGGLHHVQAPGEWVPRIFQSIQITFEELDLVEYRQRLAQNEAGLDFRSAVINDLEARMSVYCL